MRGLKHTLRLLGQSWRSWLGFEALFRLIAAPVVFALLMGSVDVAMGLGGLSFLTYENVFSFATSPAFLFGVFVWLVLLALIVLFELSVLYYALARDASGDGLRIFDAVRYALSRLPGLIRTENLPIFAYLLVFLPLAAPGVVVGLVRGMDLSTYLTGFVWQNPVQTLLLGALCLVLAAIVLRHVFLVVFLVSDDLTFLEAAARARTVGRGHVIADALAIMLVPNILVVGMSFVLVVLLLPLLVAWDFMAFVADVFGALTVLVDAVVAMPVTFATMLALLEGRGHTLVRPRLPDRGPLGRAVPVASTILLAFSLVGIGLYCHQSVVVPLQGARTLGGRSVEVCAHRGGASKAPENTMAAFRQAKKDGADSCEIDVRQSADGALFVSHDANFRRISHVDKRCWELTIDQISRLDATGDAWKGKVEPQHYPLLDEVISWAADEGMRLEIELKPTGHEVDFEESVVDMIETHDFWDLCMVTSQSYRTIVRVRELAPESTCCYVTSTAYGDICRLEAADAFSLEAITATPTLVSYLHDHDRLVLAWEEGFEPSMRRLVANGVDVLVTDDVARAVRVAEEANALSPQRQALYSLIAVLA